jgi:hypothetical protein
MFRDVIYVLREKEWFLINLLNQSLNRTVFERTEAEKHLEIDDSD